jgi:N,N'-diacetyllegionaminate synthase
MVEINGRRIGPGNPCFVIAEAGVNHNGDLAVALELVRRAAECGADAVKFQTFRAERVATAGARKAAYQLANTKPGESQIDMLKALELSEEVHVELIDACNAAGIIFLSTPYNVEDIEMLDRLGVPAFKIASGQIVELAFLDEIRRTGRPALLSTGMASLGEVERAISVFGDQRDRLVVLQCTTNYPSPVRDANLRAMLTMRDAFGVSVGYSDHTAGMSAAIASVALGACVVEKHFTLGRSMPGPDHSSSAEPAEFAELVRSIRDVEAALGTPMKRPTDSELLNRPQMRRSIVARVAIPAGSVLNDSMVTFKRPGTGISPAKLSDVVGRSALVPIAADEFITWAKISPV